MLTILGTLKRRPPNTTQMSKWPPHADVALWTNGSEFLTYLYEWAFCSVDTTVACEHFVTCGFAVLLIYRLLWQILFPKLFDLCVTLIYTKVDNAGNLCGHIKNTLFRQQCRITAKGSKIFKGRSFNCRLFFLSINIIN